MAGVGNQVHCVQISVVATPIEGVAASLPIVVRGGVDRKPGRRRRKVAFAFAIPQDRQES